MSKTIFVSNRLPVTVQKKGDELIVSKSIGGLATGLKSFHEQANNLWIGWPGLSSDKASLDEQKEIKNQLTKNYNCHPVFLSQKDIDLYYEGFSNRTIWPLFHYFAEKTEHDIKTWQSYQKVNQFFYKNIKPYLEDDTVIWIHDYQLMLLPQLIRNEFPKVKIGFFLHIPFPSYELFRLLIWKTEILEGLLGADLIGFHTYDYVRHFMSSIRRILNLTHQFYRIQYNHRTISVDAFPMGIDYEFFANQKSSKAKKPKEKIILSVDRLDYTKGIVERLKAFQTFLKRYPKYRTKVKLHLIVAPSRANLETYDTLHRQIEKLVSEINGKYGTFDWMPIWYLYQSFDQEDLISYYKQADILLVTPLRDGMNLIAKEYIASSSDYKGMLIISETAGAASELSEAIIVNPNDAENIALGIKEALEMDQEDMISRNKIMHERLKRYNVEFWAKEFLTRLNAVEHQVISKDDDEYLDINDLKQHYQKANKRLILLDYDGTLVSFTKTPSQAYPSRKLKNLLTDLANHEKNDLVVISGRDHETLERWLGDLPVNLVGDHGLWHRAKGDAWKKTLTIDNSWKPAVFNVLERFVDRMPGSFIEEKSYSIALHYRGSEPDMMSMKINEIKDALFSLKGSTLLEIQQGNKVIEIKDQRVNKGIASQLYSSQKAYDFILVAGDDTTDEDMFKEQKDAFSVKIGYGVTLAKKRIETVKAFRTILEALNQIK
jgi:trehalose 6-phosphate synthase/phosphatase